MPALTTSAAPQNLEVGKTAKAQPSKKTRVVRRRRRGAGGDSDDEIEREAASDSDSDAPSSLASDSDQDDESEHETNRIITPSTTQSPPPVEAGELKSGQDAAAPPFNTASLDWSEMVAQEDIDGAGELPVIEFADLGKPATEPLLVPDAPAPAMDEEPDVNDDTAEPVEPKTYATPVTSAPRRPAGQNARMAYQERLEKDPAFIPRIGEFWGHDDRLFDKDTRPLSTWWRGRGRGGLLNRGRGGGRGGFVGHGQFAPGFAPGFGPNPGPDGQGSGDSVVDLPPVERQWTHDGFEEQKKRDEVRKRIHEHKTERDNLRGGRGGLVPGRGRGGGISNGVVHSVPQPTTTAGHKASSPVSPGNTTNAFPSTSTALPSTLPSAKPSRPFKTAATQPLLAPPLPPVPRVWFAQKPEQKWTKQHDGFLHIEMNLKPRPGLGPGYKVRLPGGEGFVVRGPPRSMQAPAPQSSTPKPEPQLPLVVHIPTNRIPSSLPTDNMARPAEEPASGETTTTIVSDVPPVAGPSVAKPLVDAQQQPHFEDNPVPNAEPDRFSHAQPQESTDPAAAAPPLEPNVPSFVPSGLPHANAYDYPPLPPGVAINQHGMPYEISSGHPVYIPPPNHLPPNVYTPPPGMHGPPGAPSFIPGHMHHHSSLSIPSAPSPDFYHHPAAQPSFHPLASWGEQPGRQFFVPARQSSRIAIRAPDGTAAEAASPSQPSSLHLDVNGATNSGYPPLSAVDLPAPQFGTSAAGPPPPGQPMYNPYPPQAQYYYPEQHYGYQQYMPQPMHSGYDMYMAPEHMPPPTGTIYYQ